jgi:hypothetical protein
VRGGDPRIAAPHWFHSDTVVTTIWPSSGGPSREQSIDRNRGSRRGVHGTAHADAACAGRSAQVPLPQPLIVLLIAVVVFFLLNERFLLPQNLSFITQQTVIVGTLAIAQTLVILTAGIDLSIAPSWCSARW